MNALTCFRSSLSSPHFSHQPSISYLPISWKTWDPSQELYKMSFTPPVRVIYPKVAAVPLKVAGPDDDTYVELVQTYLKSADPGVRRLVLEILYDVITEGSTEELQLRRVSQIITRSTATEAHEVSDSYSKIPF